MSAHVSLAVPEASLAPRFVADARILGFLAAFVRRRVPAQWSEDVVQSVLCSALEADAPPAPHAVRGWLAGIARHKIADFHRRGRRDASMHSAADFTDLRAGPEEGSCLEARDLLARADALARGDERRTLEWIVRAHEGEALEEIARDEALPAPLVRQRVTRLRRALRAALLAAAAALVVLVVVSRRPQPDTIRPEAIAPSEARPRQAAASPLAAMQGTWLVADLTCARDVPTAACIAMRLARLDVRGAHATLVLGDVRRDAMLRVGDDGVLRVRSSPDDERALHVTLAGSRLEVSSKLGAVTLVRTHP